MGVTHCVAIPVVSDCGTDSDDEVVTDVSVE